MQLRQLSPRTPQPISKDPVVLIPRLVLQGPHENQLALYSTGSAEPMTKGERASLLEKVLAGEHVELEFEATTFIQRDTPNRNFIRFQPGVLPSLAKSFAGQPFLMNHDDRNVASRGGTILASKLEHNEDGSKSMRMRVRAVKSWAVEGLLDGTIDRFSIAWDRGGTPLSCSIHLSGWYECSCRLGSKLEDGRVPELLVTGTPVGTEMSGVNVPAVVGTGVGSISELSGIDDPGLLADILGRDATGSADNEQDITMKNLAQMIAILGLAATATEDDVAAAVQANTAKLAIAEKSAKEQGDALATIAAAEKKKSETEQLATVETAIAMLKTKGKLKAQNDPEETELRAFAAQSMDVFAYAVKTKLGATSVTPVGARLPAADPDPQPTGGPEGKTFLAANPETAKWLAKAGISTDDFEKHGATAREMHGQLTAAQR